MRPVLDDLLNDGRLARLLSGDAHHCALQLWILQIKSKQSIENRIVYGRLVPYYYSNDRWSAPEEDSFNISGTVQSQIIRLNLYVKSARCSGLLSQLSRGRTISEISDNLKLGLSGRLKARLGATALSEDLTYRPVAYLLNRDANDQNSPSSPHGGAGALSASICQSDKVALFRLGQDYDVALTELVVQHLNADTGLDFGGADTARLGDLELLVFPALDDHERPLLITSWIDAPCALIVRFNPMQVPIFSDFLFRLSITNDGQIVYSGVAAAKRNDDDFFECKFELGEPLRGMPDSTELEVFGLRGDHSREGTLCCRWRIGYFREVDLQMRMVGYGANSVKFDWLEKTARPSVSARVKTALTINRGGLGLTNRIGGREPDPWVPANHALASLFARLHPKKSEGRFFLRWGQGDGEGRLQFVEWFKALLAKHQQHQVIIFDPYFDVAGLGLVILCAAPNADYIVFTSRPMSSAVGEAAAIEPSKRSPGRINDLLANCEQNRHLLNRIKLRICGLKEGRLHDRYILIMGPDNLPVAGFNLSNSIQKAAENYPLLITPIPADVLLEVEKYKAGLMNEAKSAQHKKDTENHSMQILFDSTASPKAQRRYEPLRLLDMALAGDVLSAWTGEPSLQRLSGAPLKARMAALGLLKDDSLALPMPAGLRNCLALQTDEFIDFKETWEVLGEVLAHSTTGDRRFQELESEPAFLEFLARFLETSFNRVHHDFDKEFLVTAARFFRESVETLLHSSYRPYNFFHATKFSVLTWSEYFAIKFLWWYAPDALLAVAEAQMACVPVEPQAPDVVRLSLLSQIVSEISISVQFDISKEQQDRLVSSSNGLLQWIGLNAIEMQLEKPGGLTAVLELIAAFTYSERVRALGWMIHHAARNPKNAEIYKDLVAALHGTLPPIIPASELKLLVNSMRGHMRQLAWAEPWLFQDAVFPLLQNDRASTDDACEIWVQELIDMLEPQLKDEPRTFDPAREGQTTNITAFLFAYSSAERQQASLKLMQPILNRHRRVVQQPLASTSDWTRWDNAFTISMWIYAFTKWVKYYLPERSIIYCALDKLSRDAEEVAMVRRMVEWRGEGIGNRSALAGFVDRVDELLSQKFRVAAKF